MVTVLKAEIYKKMEFYSFVNWISLVEMFQFHYKQIKHMTIYKIWQCKRIQLLLIIAKLIIINAIFKKKKCNLQQILNKIWFKIYISASSVSS